MTTETNAAPDAISAAIDNLVAAGGGFETTQVATPQPNLKYNTETGCHRPAYRSQGVIGILEPVDDRRNEASA